MGGAIPLYSIKKIDDALINDKNKDLIENTCLQQYWIVSDRLVGLHPDKGIAVLMLRSMGDLPSFIAKQGGNVNLFITYQFEMFWFFDVSINSCQKVTSEQKLDAGFLELARKMVKEKAPHIYVDYNIIDKTIGKPDPLKEFLNEYWIITVPLSKCRVQKVAFL